jgi:nucleoid DNA-binding protein
MRKSDLIARLAETTRQSPAQAADRLDAVVHGLLKKLRKGKPASLPGLGTLMPRPATPRKARP